jgi:hypothetical protein
LFISKSIVTYTHFKHGEWYQTYYAQRISETKQFCIHDLLSVDLLIYLGDRHSRDRMVVGFTTTYAISAYHHWCCEFESRSGRGVEHYVIKFVSDLRQSWWFSPGPPVSSTNKTDRHDITEILLKMALNTIKQTKQTI